MWKNRRWDGEIAGWRMGEWLGGLMDEWVDGWMRVCMGRSGL